MNLDASCIATEESGGKLHCFAVTVVTLKQRFQFLMKLFWFDERWIRFCLHTPRRHDILKENTLTEINVKK